MSATNQNSSAASASYSSAFSSPPPPLDLGAYARSMHQHTKRQMDSVNRSRQNSNTPNNGAHSTSGMTSSVPNGVSNHRVNPGDNFSY